MDQHVETASQNVSSSSGSVFEDSLTESNNSTPALHSFEIESDSEKSMQVNDQEVTQSMSNAASVPKTRKTQIWSTVARYSTYEEAHEALVREGFRKHGHKDGKDGRKSNYHCQKIKQTAKEQCAAQRRIYADNSRVDFEVQTADSAHTCIEKDKTDHSKSISEAMKRMVEECSSNRMTAKHIIKHIESLKENHDLFTDESVPNATQIYYILRAHKERHNPKMIYLGQLMEWCENHSSTPDDIDEPFVIGFQSLEMDVEAANFRIVVSTRRLLQNCANSDNICIDATYKVNWNEFPYILVGRVDKAKKLHPFCFALTVHETTDDYNFVFESLKNGVEKFTNEILQPKVLIADGDKAIRKAFMESFPRAKLIVMCYVHVKRNVDKNKDKYSKENRQHIFNDIELCHLASTPAKFRRLTALFMKKWSKKEPKFASYFKKQWLDSHCNWYEGAATYTPSTNNAVEGMFDLLCFLQIIREENHFKSFFLRACA